MMVKTVGSGHKGSCADVESYLNDGPKAGRAPARTRTRDAGSASDVENYLERGHGREGRCLAFWHSQNMFCGQRNWARWMDQTRRRWGKDSGRTYYHFVLSPDPEDRVSPEECRDVAAEWVARCFPGAEAVAVVHDDNEGRIPHAHVIVNAVYPSDGRKVHRSDRQVTREARAAQDVSRAHGLHELPDIESERRRVRSGELETINLGPRRVTSAERGMRGRGGRSWVATVRDALDAAVPASDGWSELSGALEARGVSMSFGRRGVVFSLRWDDGSERRVRGESLGLAYTEGGLESRMGVDFDRALGIGGSRRSEVVTSTARLLRHDRPSRLRTGAAPSLEELVARRVTSRYTRGRRLEEAISAVATIRREGISSKAMLARALGEADSAWRGAEYELEGMESALSSAEEVMRRSEEARQARAEAESLPHGFLDVASRKRRNELIARAEGDEAWCERRLETASGWLDERAASWTSVDARAMVIQRAVAARAEELSFTVDQALDRLESLSNVDRVINGGGATAVRQARTAEGVAPEGKGSSVRVRVEQGRAPSGSPTRLRRSAGGSANRVARHARGKAGSKRRLLVPEAELARRRARLEAALEAVVSASEARRPNERAATVWKTRASRVRSGAVSAKSERRVR